MRLLLAFFAAILLAACSGSTQYYMIPAASGTNSPAPSVHSSRTYALRNLTLPDYLTDQYIIYYDQNGKINRDSRRRWADEPDDNIRRVLSQNLSRSLAPAQLYNYPLAANIRPERLLDIQIQEMIGSRATRQFRAMAVWQTTEANKENPRLHYFERTYPMSDANPETLIDLYSRALNDLANAIAPTLTKP